MSYSSSNSKFAKRASRKQTLSLLVCGTPGTGKSAFVNTFFGQEVVSGAKSANLNTLYFSPTTLELEEPLEDGTRVVLTMTETEGFGYNINHSSDVEAIAQYIECRFDEVLSEESRIRRNPKFKDNRIDACLYFIEPTGHGLREVDILSLKRLSTIVNVIPVLARADSLTKAEISLNKRLINEDIQFHDIAVFDFSYDDDNGELNEDDLDSEVFSHVPFAITSSSEFKPTGEVLYIRKHPFGIVDILDPNHSDFKLLRDVILNGYFTELKERTHYSLYETYRTQRLDPQHNHRSSLLLPQELADHAATLKGAQLQREAARLKEEDARIMAELEAKKLLILKREQELLELERRINEEESTSKVVHTKTNESTAAHSKPEAETGYESAVESTTEAKAGNGYSESHKETETEVVASEEHASESKKLYMKQSASRKELNKLQAELGDLEQQRNDIQKQQIANSEPTSAKPGALNGSTSSLVSQNYSRESSRQNLNKLETHTE